MIDPDAYRQRRRQLTQDTDVVHDPDRTALRRDDEILLVALDVGDRHRRQVLIEVLPVRSGNNPYAQMMSFVRPTTGPTTK